MRRFLALSISLLGAVALLSTLDGLGFDHTGLLTDASLVLFGASGWAFFRFRDSLLPVSPRAIRFSVRGTLADHATRLLGHLGNRLAQRAVA